ncbi:MAG: hypothetical protein ABSE86_37745 [Bryobacteraceae bacterium]|jgi:hypothetical protein
MRIFLAILLPLASSALADSPFEQLWQYQGTWDVTMSANGAKAASNSSR